MCGAAPLPLHALRTVQGLSPRVWGSLQKITVSTDTPGSIPTCVGQPSLRAELRIVPTVYPHVCGAAVQPSQAAHITQGLSPRVWGSPRQEDSGSLQERSIPTCVGQPLRIQHLLIPMEVYPHVCGAANGVTRDPLPNSGLSPRVWGSLLFLPFFFAIQWSIPTCVGQPLVLAFLLRHSMVYPHVCGAAWWLPIFRESRKGLSPRVWGSLILTNNVSWHNGSIPTCVGQPGTPARPDSPPEVYPHVCGAATPARRVFRCVQGLSPRVWGSPVLAYRPATQHRSIPTCVGQPEAQAETT